MKNPVQPIDQSVASLSSGAVTLQKFELWISDHEAAGDWAEYLRGGKLNRTEVAKECGFGTPAFRQNPAIAQALAVLEERLQVSGILGPSPAASETEESKTRQAADQRVLASKASADRRVKEIEEQNASLRAENRDLREQLKKYKLLDEHLSSTGRLLQA